MTNTALRDLLAGMMQDFRKEAEKLEANVRSLHSIPSPSGAQRLITEALRTAYERGVEDSAALLDGHAARRRVTMECLATMKTDEDVLLEYQHDATFFEGCAGEIRTLKDQQK